MFYGKAKDKIITKGFSAKEANLAYRSFPAGTAYW